MLFSFNIALNKDYIDLLIMKTISLARLVHYRKKKPFLLIFGV